jgi:hypothetical protein
VGAEYLLQASASGVQLMRYTGSGENWSWTAVAAHAELNNLDAEVYAASFDTSGVGGARALNYQIRALDAAASRLGDSYVLTLSIGNNGMIFDVLNHPL